MKIDDAISDRGTDQGSSSWNRRDLVRAAMVVFLLALGVRWAFLAVAGPEITGDSEAYIQIAINLVDHGSFSLAQAPPYEPTIRRPPGYSSFLAALGLAGVTAPWAIAFVQALFDATTAVLVMLLARTVLSPAWALAAGVFYVVHPGAIAFTNAVLSETLFTSLLVASVALVALGAARERVWLSAAGGVALGAANLTRPIALLLPILLAVIVLLVAGTPRRRAHAAALFVCSLLVVAPWCVRSSLLAGQFVPVQGMSTQNLYNAAMKRSTDEPDPYYTRSQTVSNASEQAELDHDAIDMTIEGIRSDPFGYLTRRVQKYPNLFFSTFQQFSRWDQSAAEAMREGNLWPVVIRGLLLVLFSAIPLGLALVGLVRSRRSFAVLLCTSVWLYMAAVHLPMSVQYRFWVPAVPFMVVSAALGAQLIAGWRPFRRRVRHAGRTE